MTLDTTMKTDNAAAANTNLVETNLAFKKLSFSEAVAYLVGTNVGAAVLSLPYAARTGGFPAVIITAVLCTFFSMISHLFITEAMLRTPEVTQLTGLFRNYLFKGKAGRYYLGFLFAITIGVAIPALTAYILGGAEALQAVTGWQRSTCLACFFIPGIAVVWLGLGIAGKLQKIVSLAMGGIIIGLTVFSILRPDFEPSRLTVLYAPGIWPLLSVGIFTCMSQTSVPEIVRGLAHKPALIPKAIRTALLINLAFVIVIPISIFGLLNTQDISQVATVSWGKALGPVGFLVANVFAFFALITSFWGTAAAILTNIVDMFHFPSDWQIGSRLIAFAITVLPSIILIAFNLVGFVELIQIAGSIGGVLLALLPVLVWRKSCQTGIRIPEYQVPRFMAIYLPWAMCLFYVGALIAAAINM
ncbi:MAG: aromatic amino acid transport family protein [Bacillota bacterium]|jgi:tyrosine-specific transport protein